MFWHAMWNIAWMDLHGRFATKTARTKCNGFGKSKEFVVLQTFVPCVFLHERFFSTYWALFSSV